MIDASVAIGTQSWEAVLQDVALSVLVGCPSHTQALACALTKLASAFSFVLAVSPAWNDVKPTPCPPALHYHSVQEAFLAASNPMQACLSPLSLWAATGDSLPDPPILMFL